MRTFSHRRALCLGVLVGVACACSHGRGSSRPAPSSPTVTAQDIADAPGQPIEKVLQSRFPGVQVQQTPDGGISVRIRGTTSVNSRTAPLYVVDGMPIEPGPNGALVGINPYDIESIKVLKDAADTAMYGVRGSNGVIVIKTKRR